MLRDYDMISGEGERMVVVCECLWFWEKLKLYHFFFFFHRKVYLYSVFYDNGISFPFGLLQGLNFGQKLYFLQGNI